MRLIAIALSMFLTTGSCATSRVALKPEAAKPEAAQPETTAQTIVLGEPDVELDIDFDPNTKHKVGRVRFDVPVTAASADELIAWIVAAKPAKLDAVVIDMNTPGGSVTAGQRLAKVIEESPVPIYCVADGMAASMGMYLLQSCHVRLMTKRTVLMAHGPSVGGFMAGKEQDFKNIAQMLKATEEALASHICKNIKLPEAECRAKFSGNNEWWLGAKEAKTVGAVDEVVADVQGLVNDLRKGMEFTSEQT